MTGSVSFARTPAEPRRIGVALGVLALVTAYLFHPLITDPAGGRFFEWDVAEQYWPDLVYLCDSLHDGELPTWNPYDRAGYPYYADPQSGMYHPINWLVCGVAGRSPGLGWATFRVVLGFFLGGVFTLMWLRRLGASVAASLIGAVVFECAPFMRHNMELNLTTAFAWLPFMLFAAEGVVQERRLRDGALLAIAISLCAWIGSPPALWFALSFLVLYFAVRAVSVLRRAGRATKIEFACVSIVALVLAASMLAVVFVPGATLAKYSVQAGRSFGSIAEGGLRARDLLALVLPREGNHLYVGLLPLAAFPIAAVLIRKEPGIRVAVYFALVIACVAVLLSLGANAFLFRIAFDWVPGVSTFRLPYRYESWLGPAAAMCVAIAFDALAQRASVLARFAMPAAVGLAIVCAADMTRALPAERHMARSPAPYETESSRRVASVATQLASQSDSRVMDEFGISCRAGTRHRLRDFRGYQDPLMLGRYERVVDSLNERPGLLPQFNARYALTSTHFLHGWDHHYLRRPDELAALPNTRSIGDGIVEFADALPFAYFVGEEHVQRTSPSNALEWLSRHAPARTLVLEGVDHRPVRPVEEAVVDASHVVVNRDSVTFDIDAPQAGYVVVNEAFYPGWVASVDGRETAIEPANVLVRAIAVDAGHHRVAMRFLPADVTWTRALLLGGLLASLGLLFFRRRGRRVTA